MILKLTVVGLVSAIVCLNGANGASYSKVFVQSGGPDVVPIEYYNYGAPAVVSSPEIARLSAAPVGSLVPVETVPNVIPPCVSPCVVTAPAVASAVPSAKLVSFSPRNVPVVLAPSKDNGYEYSYVVYDENTGDRKAQRELSDGSVVRGEYSFLQPDGYVREVQYKADDVNGFNVIVKNILPEAVSTDKKGDKANPCTIKHEELIEEPLSEKVATEPGHEGHHHTADGKEINDVEPNPDDVNKVEMASYEAIQVIEPTVLPQPQQELVQEQDPVPVQQIDDPEAERFLTVAPVQTPKQQIDEQAKPLTDIQVKPTPEQKSPEPVTELTHVEQVRLDIVTPEAPQQAKVEAVDQPQANAIPSLKITYEEILRCLQAKGALNGLNYSPLTYIILPASNRPC